MHHQLKIRSGDYMVPALMVEAENRWFFSFAYNKPLLATIKAMEGAKYHGFEGATHSKLVQELFQTNKVWSIKISQRNAFQLQYLIHTDSADDPYVRWDRTLDYKINFDRPLYDHQKFMVSTTLARHFAVWGVEMRCVSGDAMIPYNRAGAGRKMKLSEMFWKFHGHTDSRGKSWNLDIPTRVRSLCDGTLRLNPIQNILHKGMQQCVKLNLKSGKSVTLTPDHEVATHEGWVRTDSLSEGDTVLSNGEWVGSDGYVRVGGYKGIHPRWSTGGVFEHILVMEAHLGRYIKKEEVVHHKNGVRHDNRLENLELIESQAEHARQHGKERTFSNLSGGINSYNGAEVCFVPHHDAVVGIEDVGKQDVYDIICSDPYRNFVADGVIVHNCGKTLAAIEVMERATAPGPWWFVAPRSALYSVQIEFDRWQSQVQPALMTYDEFKKRVENWPEGQPPPGGIFFDESHLLKSPTSQRSQCAKHVADAMREEYCQEQWWKHSDTDPYIVCMTGSPAPKGPDDWWSQAEIAAPGFLREGKINSFRDGLGLFDDETSSAGWKYKRRITWLDNSEKCAVCGAYQSDHPPDHTYQPSVNEVARLYRRLSGLTTVLFAKDCTDIPTKIHRQLHCEVSPSSIRAAKLIIKSTSRAAQVQILLRELSDGFQYKKDEETGTREVLRTHCPKDQLLQDILESHSEDGRLVVYAGFQASVDNCVKVAQMMDWTVIRWDGRGQLALTPDNSPIETDNVLRVFNDTETYDRVCFIGQADSAGTGLNLSVANEIVYYSNSFKSDSRVQSSARIDKPGKRAALITDLIHLPTDTLVLDNLNKKLDVQAISMGDIDAVLAKWEADNPIGVHNGGGLVNSPSA